VINRRELGSGLLASCAAVALLSGAGSVQAAEAVEEADLTPEQRMGRLLEAIRRVEGVRAVKAIQHSFAQYAHHGLWGEIGRLFAQDASLEWDGTVVVGPDAIAAYFRETLGFGRDGLAPGEAHAQLAMTPVITLSPNGTSARGRWHEVRMTSGETAWAASLFTADYGLVNGRWKILRLVNHPIFEGSFESGWMNVAEDLAPVPYFNTPQSAGRPETGRDARPEPLSRLAEAQQRIAALEAEDAARNLQNVYGYYLDRKMWDDIADLFEVDGTLEIEGAGRFQGRSAIRKALERDGPAGLRHGELNDHPQLNMTVESASSGTEARVRGLDLGMIGLNGAEAYWTLTTFDNRFVRRDGVWRIAAMRLYPEARADYYKGWMEPPAEAQGSVRRIAAFPPNPATGQDVIYPAGFEPAESPMTKREPANGAPAGSILEDAELSIMRSTAFDAIENISTLVGNYLNDSMWYELSRMFTENAWRKSPSAGYYQGRDRIWKMQFTRNGPLRRPRSFLPLHLRIQPVIHVSQDGRTARLRSRLLQFNSAFGREGSMTGGMYEDRLMMEDGIWRFELDAVDHIWLTQSYSKGWARLPEGAGEAFARSPAALLEAMPPDRPIDGPAYPPFPAIGPMPFHYRNPVSGRAPPDLLPPWPDS